MFVVVLKVGVVVVVGLKVEPTVFSGLFEPFVGPFIDPFVGPFICKIVDPFICTFVKASRGTFVLFL